MTLEQLYNQVPTFKCKPGCHDCCGPVPFSKEEWERVDNKKPQTALDCPFICESPFQSGCEIYEARPLLCRMFGTVDNPLMICPYGCAPDKLLTQEEGDAILKEYRSMSISKESSHANTDIQWATNDNPSDTN